MDNDNNLGVGSAIAAGFFIAAIMFATFAFAGDGGSAIADREDALIQGGLDGAIQTSATCDGYTSAELRSMTNFQVAPKLFDWMYGFFHNQDIIEDTSADVTVAKRWGQDCFILSTTSFDNILGAAKRKGGYIHKEGEECDMEH